MLQKTSESLKNNGLIRSHPFLLSSNICKHQLTEVLFLLKDRGNDNWLIKYEKEKCEKEIDHQVRKFSLNSSKYIFSLYKLFLRVTFLFIIFSFVLSLVFFCFCFFDGTGVSTQGLLLNRQVLYHLSHPSPFQPFFCWVFLR
jgi:hypothetical protein